MVANVSLFVSWLKVDYMCLNKIDIKFSLLPQQQTKVNRLHSIGCGNTKWGHLSPDQHIIIKFYNLNIVADHIQTHHYCYHHTRVAEPQMLLS